MPYLHIYFHLFFSDLGSCSCTDCEESCAPPDFTPFQKQEFAKYGDIDYWQIIIIIIFAIAFWNFGIYFIFKNLICVNNPTNVVSVEECNKKQDQEQQMVVIHFAGNFQNGSIF